MSNKPEFSDLCAGVFLQIGTIPAEIYMKELHDRLPEGNVVKTALRSILKESKEGIDKARDIMEKEFERQQNASKLVVPSTEEVATINKGKNT